ncbi:MAG: hypothetical protein ACQ9MH_03180 [Nitrospinales bacterium]
MENPKEILRGLLGAAADLDELEKTGEPLDLLAETLIDLQKCRKIRDWLVENSGIDALIAPAVFHSLLSIQELNTLENADRDLNVEVTRINETRDEDDPVTAANFNSILRELYRDLSGLNDSRQKEFSDLILASEISGDMLDRIENFTSSIRSLNLRGVGYLLTGWKVSGIEKSFQSNFPNSMRAHPLRKNLRRVEMEMVFYRKCLEVNIKWAPVGMDLFNVIRRDGLELLLGNLEEMGNGIWNVVYNGLRLKKSLALVGIKFDDARTLMEDELVSLPVE